ncbi:MAG: ATP synthase F1 subunit delta [Alphaproteobacteria bacterium]|nr:ATP synthase F1 subunit delta [Alphaproteobacteria bacterium]
MQKVSKYKTANTYAKAWFGAASDLKDQDQVFEEVSALLKSVEENPALWSKLASPLEEGQTKLIEQTAKKLKLSKVSSAALAEITQNGRLKLLGLILRDFQKLYYQEKGIVEVTVDTAVSLSAAQDKKLKKVLSGMLDKEVKVVYRLKPEVLGGLAISFGSFLIDDTLAFKLEQVKQTMIAK